MKRRRMLRQHDFEFIYKAKKLCEIDKSWPDPLLSFIVHSVAWITCLVTPQHMLSCLLLSFLHMNLFAVCSALTIFALHCRTGICTPSPLNCYALIESEWTGNVYCVIIMRILLLCQFILIFIFILFYIFAVFLSVAICVYYFNYSFWTYLMEPCQ